jgi:hypothetical protein
MFNDLANLAFAQEGGTEYQYSFLTHNSLNRYDYVRCLLTFSNNEFYIGTWNVFKNNISYVTAHKLVLGGGTIVVLPHGSEICFQLPEIENNSISGPIFEVDGLLCSTKRDTVGQSFVYFRCPQESGAYSARYVDPQSSVWPINILVVPHHRYEQWPLLIDGVCFKQLLQELPAYGAAYGSPHELPILATHGSIVDEGFKPNVFHRKPFEDLVKEAYLYSAVKRFGSNEYPTYLFKNVFDGVSGKVVDYNSFYGSPVQSVFIDRGFEKPFYTSQQSIVNTNWALYPGYIFSFIHTNTTEDLSLSFVEKGLWLTEEKGPSVKLGITPWNASKEDITFLTTLYYYGRYYD